MSSDFFSPWVFPHWLLRLKRQQGKTGGGGGGGGGRFFKKKKTTHLYHLYVLYVDLDITQAITAKSLPLHISSNETRIWNT